MNTNQKIRWGFDEPILSKVSFAEMMTYGEYESLWKFPHTFDASEKPLNPWVEHDPNLAKADLIPVVNNGPTRFDLKQRMVTITTSIAPLGFSNLCCQVSSALEVSDENICRIASKHGIAKMADDPRTAVMWEEYSSMMCNAVMGGNKLVINALANPSYYTYKDMEYAYISFPTLWWVHDLLKTLAGLYGITPSALVPIAIYHSIITQPESAQWPVTKPDKKQINEELDYFWKLMGIRRDTIKRIGQELNKSKGENNV
ncbi:MAG: hypothetical protein WC455_07260 [Dehalococcoidia bacterium]